MPAPNSSVSVATVHLDFMQMTVLVVLPKKKQNGSITRLVGYQMLMATQKVIKKANKYPAHKII